jgi:mono/diheme cytochrome c family protein
VTGFRRFAALSAVLATALAACGGGQDSADTTAAPPPSVALSERGTAGQVLFEDNCTVCHGEDLGGGAGPALGFGSQAADKPVEVLETQIRTGGNGMPSWGGLLEDSEIADLIAFLSEMQGR